MGKWFSWFERQSPVSVEQVIRDFKRIDMLMREMILKYDTELETCTAAIQAAPRKKLVVLLQRRKILKKYIKECEARLTNCLHKQCALEQLELTRIQLEAIKNTSRVFHKFTTRHDLAKVEELHDNMVELQEHVMDVHNLMTEPVMDSEDYDVEEELEEPEREEKEGVVAEALLLDSPPPTTEDEEDEEEEEEEETVSEEEEEEEPSNDGPSSNGGPSVSFSLSLSFDSL